MSSDPAGTAPMTDERPMGVLDQPNEGRVLHASLGGVVYARHPVRTHLVTADRHRRRRGRRALRGRASGRRRGSWRSASGWWPSRRAGRTRSPRSGQAASRGSSSATSRDRDTASGSARRRRCSLPSRRSARPGSCSLPPHRRVTRPFGVHGVFYRVAGPQAKAIDGPTSYTIPPYNQAATLGPKDPDRAARAIAAAIDAPVAIIDANDAGCAVLGCQPGRRPARWWSGSSPTTRSGRRGSRRRSASCARFGGRPATSCRRSRAAA